MTAAEKLKRAGVEVVADHAGRSVSVVYRWIKALNEGERLSDRAMRELMAATASAPDPIAWSDFEPARSGAAA